MVKTQGWAYDGMLENDENNEAGGKRMKELEDRILQEGVVIDNEILKVDSFINHQIDIDLLNRIGAELSRDFTGAEKILTVETSGIAYAVAVAQHLGNIPVVFAKKSKSRILDLTNSYTAEVRSFTRGTVSTIAIDRRFLKPGEKVLLVDDFLAEGNAALGLLDIASQAKAEVLGVAAVIEKSFQGGRAKLEGQGLKVVSAANIVGFKEGKALFLD